MNLSKITEWIKLPPRYLIPISVVTGTLIILDKPLLSLFGLSNFVEKTLPYISIIFFTSTALIITSVIVCIINWGKRKIASKNEHKNITDRLCHLTQGEKLILLGYFLEDSRSQQLLIGDGTVRELESFGIIYRSSNIGSIDYFAYNIQPWVWNYVKENWKKIFNEGDINKYQDYINR
ncbi:MAG TPA: hypothetical protein G4N92_08330 [Anaerolineae bacterium]|nr:hypothetical protein [Anaerolineae bacterium]